MIAIRSWAIYVRTYSIQYCVIWSMATNLLVRCCSLPLTRCLRFLLVCAKKRPPLTANHLQTTHVRTNVPSQVAAYYKIIPIFTRLKSNSFVTLNPTYRLPYFHVVSLGSTRKANSYSIFVYLFAWSGNPTREGLIRSFRISSLSRGCKTNLSVDLARATWGVNFYPSLLVFRACRLIIRPRVPAAWGNGGQCRAHTP